VRMGGGGRIRRQHQAAVWQTGKGLNDAPDVAGVLDGAQDQLDRQRLRHSLGFMRKIRKRARLWVDDESGARDAWGDLLQHCQPFSGDATLVQREACKIAARPCQVGNEACSDRVPHEDENNRNVSALSPEGSSKPCTHDHDHIGTWRESSFTSICTCRSLVGTAKRTSKWILWPSDQPSFSSPC